MRTPDCAPSTAGRTSSTAPGRRFETIAVERIARHQHHRRCRRTSTARNAAARQRLLRGVAVVDVRAEHRRIEQHGPRLGEPIEVEIDARRRDRERRAGDELHDAGDHPAAKHLPEEAAVVGEERQPVAAVEREAVRRVESRFRAARVGGVRALSGCCRRRRRTSPRTWCLPSCCRCTRPGTAGRG